MGWDELADKELIRLKAQARAEETAECFRCDSDSDEGSATCGLSQSERSTASQSDCANPFSLWWSEALKTAAAELKISSATTKLERGSINALGLPANILGISETDESYRRFIAVNHDAVEWLVRFEPVTVIMEQVEGFGEGNSAQGYAIGGVLIAAAAADSKFVNLVHSQDFVHVGVPVSFGAPSTFGELNAHSQTQQLDCSMQQCSITEARKVLGNMSVSKFSILLDNRITACECASCLAQPESSLRRKPWDEKLKAVSTLQAVEAELPGPVKGNILGMYIEHDMKELLETEAENRMVIKAHSRKLWQRLLPLSCELFSGDSEDARDSFDPTNPFALAVRNSIRDSVKTKIFDGSEAKEEIEEEGQALECNLLESCLDAMGSDAFFAMLSEPQKDGNQQKMFFFFEILLQASDTELFATSLEAEPGWAQDFISRVIFVGKAIAVLFSPHTTDLAVDEILKTAGAEAKSGHLPQHHIQQLTQVARVKATNHAQLLENPAACEPLAASLSILQLEEGCLDELQRLRQWMKENSTLLKTGQTKAYFEQLAASADAEELSSDDGALPLELLKQFPSKISNIGERMDGRVSELLVKSLPLLLRALKHYAACHCFQFKVAADDKEQGAALLSSWPKALKLCEPVPENGFFLAQCEVGRLGCAVRAAIKKLERSGATNEARVEADRACLLQGSAAKAVLDYQRASAKADDELGNLRRAGSSMLSRIEGVALTSLFQQDVDNTILSDCIQLRAAQIMNQCRVAGDQFADQSMGFHVPASGWKKSIKTEATLSDVLKQAALTIGTLKGNLVKTRLDEVLQDGVCKPKQWRLLVASKDIRSFIDNFKSVPFLDMPSLNETASKIKVLHTQGVVLTIEALLCHAMNIKAKANAREIVRAQLAELAGRSLSEDLIEPTLLSEAKGLMS
ncbi:GIP [Symbiodinium sp. CCMP2592]|nr:GIP [Symbiodinium sp. CCMP2592]